MDQLFPSWRNSVESTRYPFNAAASLSNGKQTILEGLLVDCVIHVIGSGSRLRLSQVTVTTDTITIFVGDDTTPLLASGTFDILDPVDDLPLIDTLDRPAGLLVSEGRRLSTLSAFGVGSFRFTAEQTELCSSVCIPLPSTGVRGFLLPDGSVAHGDVWLAGSAGMVLGAGTTYVAGQACETPVAGTSLRLSAVGDPLFKRRACSEEVSFVAPTFIQTIIIRDANGDREVTPDEFGRLSVTVNNDLASDTILRVRPTAGGLVFEAVGSSTARG